MTDAPGIADEGEKGLASAIEALYTTFARYKLTEPVEGCPHCTSSEDDRLLSSAA